MAAPEPTLLTSDAAPQAAPLLTSSGAARLPSVAPRARVTVAGFLHRLVASLVDAAIVLPAGTLLAAMTCKLAGVHLPSGRFLAPDRLLDLAIAGDPGVWSPFILLLVIALLYDGLFLTFQGRTLGMRVLGLRVIDLYGEPPSVPRVLLRLGGQLVATATLGLGALWGAIDRDKRALQDHLAGTLVIKRDGGEDGRENDR